MKLLIDQTFENIWDVAWPKQGKQTHYVPTGATGTRNLKAGHMKIKVLGLLTWTYFHTFKWDIINYITRITTVF